MIKTIGRLALTFFLSAGIMFAGLTILRHFELKFDAASFLFGAIAAVLQKAIEVRFSYKKD